MNTKTKILLTLFTILKGLFFCMTYPLVWLAVILDLIVHILTIGYYETYISETFNRFCVYVLQKILTLEFKLIFNKYS